MSADIMFEKAKTALQGSYSPYSKFKVGCCIKSESGNYYVGTNIENASYSLAMCAEATAIAHMIMAGENKIAEVLVIADCEECTPCGACRQRINEFAPKNTPIHIASLSSLKGSYSLGELLPHAFGPENLEVTPE